MKSYRKSQKRKISLLFAAVLLAGLFLSAIFVPHHIDHDCTGEDCPICAVILLARVNLQNLNFTPEIASFVQRFSFVSLAFFVPTTIFVFKTLVTEKIRLND